MKQCLCNGSAMKLVLLEGECPKFVHGICCFPSRRFGVWFGGIPICGTLLEHADCFHDQWWVINQQPLKQAFSYLFRSCATVSWPFMGFPVGDMRIFMAVSPATRKWSNLVGLESNTGAWAKVDTPTTGLVPGARTAWCNVDSSQLLRARQVAAAARLL